MPKITQIKPQKKTKNRFNIFVDGRFAFSFSAQYLVKSALHAGQKLSQKELSTLINQSGLQKLYDRALFFLSFRPRSEKEVLDYLRKRISKLESRVADFGEESAKTKEDLIVKAIDKLKKQKLIDDKSFAAWFCQQRIKFRPRSQRMLGAELRQKGISRELIQQSIKVVDEEEMVQKILTKKQKTLPQKLSLKAHQKLLKSLLRQGFSYSNAKKAIDSFFKKG
jgi:regulatory protein